MTRRKLLNYALVSAAAVSASTARPALAAAALPKSNAAASGGDAPVWLTLLHTNDMHGHVWEENAPQGLVRLATRIEQVRAECPNVLLLDAGDMIHGTPEEKAFKGKPILDAMNALRYDVATAGNHEFDWGQAVLKNALAHARFPVLSANVRDAKTGKPWNKLKPTLILEKGGVRVGVFGVTTLETVSFEWPRTLDGVVFTDPYEAAREAVADLQKAGVDVIVALSHLGYVPDKKLAQTVPGIDLIIGGHSHTTLDKQVWENNVLIAQTGAYGKALGRIDLLIQPKRSDVSGKVLAINGKNDTWWGHNGASNPIPNAGTASLPDAPLWLPEPATPENKTALAAYRPWREKIRPALDEVLTTTAAPLPGASTTGETVLGNLLADAIRAHTKTDIAFMANSQINASGLPAGPITGQSLYRVLGSYTRQHLVVARVPGDVIASVVAALSHGSAGKPLPIHVSGLTVGESGAVQVGGAPLVPTQIYTVGAAAHVVQDYFLNKPGVVIVSDEVSAPAVRDAAIAYLRGHAPLNNRLPANGPRWTLPAPAAASAA